MSKEIKRKINKEKGQVVLMVLLASALILTLGLSASKITTTETKIDTDQELLKQAFNTAESGIDYYLATGEKTYQSNGNSGNANVTVNSLGGSKSLMFDSMTLKGSQEYFWLVNHNPDGSFGTTYYSDSNSSIKICGGNGDYEVGYFYLSGSDYKVKRLLVTTNNDCSGNFDISSGKSLLLTVMPVTVDSKIGIEGETDFPIQGEEISSTGKVEGVNNTVTVQNRYSFPLSLSDAVISGNNVTSKK